MKRALIAVYVIVHQGGDMQIQTNIRLDHTTIVAIKKKAREHQVNYSNLCDLVLKTWAASDNPIPLPPAALAAKAEIAKSKLRQSNLSPRHKPHIY